MDGMIPELIVFRNKKDGTTMNYHSVNDSAAVDQLFSNPDIEVINRYPLTPGNPYIAAKRGEGTRDLKSTVRHMGAEAIPYGTAAILTAMQPELLPIEGPVLGALARMGIAGVSGLVTDPVSQTMQGNKPTVGHAIGRGAETMAGQGIGEIFAGTANLGSKILAHESFTGAPKRVKLSQNAATNRLEREALDELGVRRFSPERMGLGQRMLEGDIPPPGRSPGEKLTGFEKIDQQIMDLGIKRQDLLKQIDKTGQRFNATNLQDEITPLRDYYMKLGRTDLVDQLNQRQQRFIEAFREPGKNGKMGKLKKWKPSELQDLITNIWEKELKALRANQNNPMAKSKNPADDFEASFLEAIQRAAKKKIDSLSPPPMPGGVGELQAIDNNIQKLSPPREALYDSELMGRYTMNPLHSPAVQARLALMMNKPEFQAGARVAPLQGDTILRMLAQARTNKDKSHAEVIQDAMEDY